MALPVEPVIEAFTSSGAVYFTGFNLDTFVFERFTNKFTDMYMDHRGGGSLREVVNTEGDRTILSVSYAFKPDRGDFEQEEQETFPLALHSDRSYTRSQPPLMWFYCVRPAVGSGATIVCDGVQFFDGLSESTRRLFREQRIVYIRNYRDGEWQKITQSEDEEELARFCAANELELTINPDRSITTRSFKHAVVKPRWSDRDAFVNSLLLVQWQEDQFHTERSIVRLEDGSRIPADVLAELREVGERLTHEVPWNDHEIVMIDNTRMLHGRRAFKDMDREIYVRMARDVPW